jgi:hypothetical protein
MASLFNLLFFAAVIGALMATFRKRYNTYYLSPDDDLYNAGGDSEDDEDNGFSSSARLRPLPDGFLPIKGETPPPVRPKPALLRPVAWTLALCFMVYTFVQMPSDVWETGRHAKIAASEDPDAPVYLDVRSVKNPATKARNVRYRVAASSGWEAEFTLMWDKTVVSRGEMESALRDAGRLVGLGDGRSIGAGRFEVVSFEAVDA